MKLKHYLELQAWGNLVLVLFFIALAFSGEVQDAFGWIVLIAFVAICGFLSHRNFRKARTTRDEERSLGPPMDATPEERIAFYRRYMILALCLAPLLPLVFLGDIDTLAEHSGRSHGRLRIFLWLYERLGYWPMLLSMPTLMLAVAFGYHIKIRHIRSGRDGHP